MRSLILARWLPESRPQRSDLRLAGGLRGACLAVALAGALAGPAHAGLFDDDEARKAIIDLRARLTALEDQGKSRSTEAAATNAQLLEQVAALRRSLLDLNNQLEAARAEVAKLRGSDEQLARDLSDVQRRQRDIGQAMDDRLRKLEPVKVTIEGREFVVDPDEKKSFEDALATLRAGEFDKSITQLGNFQRRYVSSPYTDLSRFWLGNALYGKRDYKEAINSFRAFVAGAPDNPKAPEALLAVANSQAEMKDAKAARKTIDELVKSYPQSEAAMAGKERLASIK